MSVLHSKQYRLLTYCNSFDIFVFAAVDVL